MEDVRRRMLAEFTGVHLFAALAGIAAYLLADVFHGLLAYILGLWISALLVYRKRLK